MGFDKEMGVIRRASESREIYPAPSVTSITLVNNTAKTQSLASLIPAGFIGEILSIKITNPDNVGRDVTVWIEDASGNEIFFLLAGQALAAGIRAQFPNTWVTTTVGDGRADGGGGKGKPALLFAGDVVKVLWAAGGASAGGTDADGLVVKVRYWREPV